jgi:hypothetical protein
MASVLGVDELMIVMVGQYPKSGRFWRWRLVLEVRRGDTSQ